MGSYLSGIAHWNGQSATHPVHLGLPEFESLTADEGVRVSGLEYDSKGNLWFVVSLLSQPLCRIDPQGNLKRFPISNSLFDKDNVTYTDLMVTSTDQIWISTENNGLVVLKENSEEDFEKVLFEVINQDNKLINQVYCLEEDREGNIWVGTNLGVITSYSIHYTKLYDDALVIGLAQAVAVLPGISRSGATIATALLLKNKREEAARFSFLMVLLPILGKAGMDLMSGEISAGGVSAPVLFIGFISAFVVGLAACKLMITIVKRNNFV